MTRRDKASSGTFHTTPIPLKRAPKKTASASIHGTRTNLNAHQRPLGKPSGQLWHSNPFEAERDRLSFPSFFSLPVMGLKVSMRS